MSVVSHQRVVGLAWGECSCIFSVSPSGEHAEVFYIQGSTDPNSAFTRPSMIDALSYRYITPPPSSYNGLGLHV